MVNAYWFQSSDCSVHHVIVAEGEIIARKTLKQIEKDIDPKSFRLVGISQFVGLVKRGTGRHLATIDGMGVQISK